MAQGRFSQPRQPRHDEDDFEAVMRRRKQDADRSIDPQPRRDASLDETQILSEALLAEEMTQVLPDLSQEIPEEPSFEESQFLEETADDPVVPAAPVYEEDDEEEEYEEERPKPKRKSGNSRKALIGAIITATVLLVVSIVAAVSLFINANADDGLILNNVTIAGVNVGGMTPEEAAKAVHRATDLTYTQQEMEVYLPDTTLLLSPENTGVKLDVDAAVEEAFNYGRTGTKEENKKARADAMISNHTIALLPYLNLDTDYIRQELDAYGELFNSTYIASSYTLEGDMPDLEGELFDENAPCQTLILNPGAPGRNLDLDKVYNDILDAYSLNKFTVEAEMSAPEEIPEALDLQEIFDALHLDPVDATMDMTTFDVTPETYGYTFDLEEAKKLLEETPYGETVTVSLEYIVPKVLAEHLDGKLFADVLGTYKTAHSNDADRTHNLKLACEAINGFILEPGDTFDYNTVVGKRTEEAGYKAAGAIDGGQMIKELGGGICQVSSTLYYSALLADVEIVNRRSHSLVSTYMPIGTDATVSWGGPEFTFKNNFNYPIRIDAEVSGGYVNISLVGTDEKDYYIKIETKTVEILSPQTEEKHIDANNNPNGYRDGQVIQQPVTGYTVYSYKLKYDKETDELISKDYEATSNYVRKNKIVVVIDQPETEPPTEAPTEAPTTPPATEAPTTATTTPPATEAPTTPPATEAPAATEAPQQAATEAPQAPAAEPPAEGTEAPAA